MSFVDTEDVDVVVVGAGAAGLALACALGEAGRSVCVLAKDFAGAGDSKIATGLLAVPVPSTEPSFAADLLRAGRGLASPELVRALANEAGDAHHFLQDRGLRPTGGEAGLTRLAAPMGGHSRARTAPTPGGGGAVGRALADGAGRGHFRVYEDHWALEVLVDAGEACGVLALDARRGRARCIWARAVALATGGIGHVFHPHSDQMRSCTGDGLLLGARAGALAVDLEQVQFTPFALVAPAHRVGVALGGAALAGEHGTLQDAGGAVVLDEVGRRTRSEVTSAIARTLALGRGTDAGGVWLSPRPADEVDWRRAWAKALRTVAAAQGAATARLEAPWHVAPTAHDHMGGLATDREGRTRVRRLFAVGQVQGGLFGADRLGSTALPAAVVFGRRAARALCGELQVVRRAPAALEQALARLTAAQHPCGTASVATLTRRLQRAAWAGIGPGRTAAGIEELQRVVRDIASLLPEVRVSGGLRFNPTLLARLELESMLWVAGAIAAAALRRTTSLGAHLRLDDQGGEEPQRTWADVGGEGWMPVEELACGW